MQKKKKKNCKKNKNEVKKKFITVVLSMCINTLT